MRDLFPGHYRPSPIELEELWGAGLFVFDTNVLLNLYSYPEEAREVFFSVLETIKDRIWIPYQVALEFHRNRLARIKSSNKAVFALKEKVQAASGQLEADFKKIEFDKRRTGIDDISERLSAARAANAKLAEALEAACARLPGLGLDDPIGDRIAALFQERVGKRPADQSTIEIIVQDGEERYKRKAPPGFKDGNKGDEYWDNGLLYKAKFGDLILWRQLLEHVSVVGQNSVIFITGDRKEDWWDEDDGKIRGPLPDLVQEFRASTNAKLFWMYPVDSFLGNAKEFLHSPNITDETIAQVKEAADNVDKYSKVLSPINFDATLSEYADLFKMRETSYWDSSGFNNLTATHEQRMRKAVVEWLIRSDPDKIVTLDGICDIEILHDDSRDGVDIIYAEDPSARSIIGRLNRMQTLIYSGSIKRYTLVVVVDREGREDVVPFFERGQNFFSAAMQDFKDITLMFGFLANGVFQPMRKFTS